MTEGNETPALSDEPRLDDRLRPAEAHRLVRQRLARLTAPWGLSAADHARLVQQMQPRTYAPGEIIVPRGVRADCLGLVVRGQVAVHLGEDGGSRLSMILLPGSAFGETMLTSGQPSRATFQALTRCEVRCLRRSDLLALRAERQIAQQARLLWRLVGIGGVMLVALIALLLALSLPAPRRALALLPMGVGQWCEEQGRAECAGQAWQVAANLNPSDPNPWLVLGAVAFESGDLAAAESDFETALALSPDLPEAHNGLGLIYARRGDYEQAIAAFERALALEPGVAATEYNLAQCLQGAQAYEEAAAHYRTALALGGPQADALVGLAVAYYQIGNMAQAADAARQALTADDSLATAYVVLGAVALAERQPEEAVSNLQQAIALDANQSQAHFFLGLAYKSLGQPEQAIAAFERALATAEDEAARSRVRPYLDELYESVN
ncbi:MAG TPA: tetratricopeptide repeat protein [Anaerolineae bacterium]|nr:tetratricopeptide repeat protein [Anaerolineae bacterium]